MIVDVIIIVLIVLSIIIGVVRGFANTVLAVASIILSIVAAFFLCTPVANLISNITNVDEDVRAKVINFIPMSEKDIEIDVNVNSVPEVVQNTIDNTVAETEESINQKKKEIINSTADRITTNVMKALSFVLIYLVVRILLFGLSILTQIAKNQEFIDKVDKGLGFWFGLVRGILLVYVALGLIKVSEVMFKYNSIVDDIHQSTIGNYLYENNLLTQGIEDLTKQK